MGLGMAALRHMISAMFDAKGAWSRCACFQNFYVIHEYIIQDILTPYTPYSELAGVGMRGRF